MNTSLDTNHSNMKIQFKKQQDKPSVLTCIREDGTTTWVKMYPGIEAHDLGHYAVETILDFKNAFYGMVAKGSNIEDFELPREQRPQKVLPQNLDSEALIAEHLVNLLMTKAQTEGEAFDIMATLRVILQENRLPFPENLTEKNMDKVWKLFIDLNHQWQQLPAGKTMEMEFAD